MAPVTIQGIGAGGIDAARRQLADITARAFKLGYQTNVVTIDMAIEVQDGQNVGRNVTIPGVLLALTFTLRPTCVDSDRPSFTVAHTTKAEQAAYLASQAETHYPQNAVQFVMQGHSTTELLDVGLTTLSLLPLPVGRLGSLLRGTARGSGETVQLFRNVGAAEFDSIASTGKFSTGAGQMEGKWFAVRGEHADQWGQRLNGGNGLTVETRIPKSLAEGLSRDRCFRRC